MALRVGRLLLPAATLMLATGCAPGDGSPAAPTPTPSPAAATPAPAAPTPTSVGTRAADPRLRQELLAMLAADQKDRSDPNAGVGGDQERTERLKEIVDRYGWPTRTLVGEDGATAAWAIAQHSDLDPPFQRWMLGLMREAAAAGEADLGDLAYLTDRVAANAGSPRPTGPRAGAGRTAGRRWRRSPSPTASTSCGPRPGCPPSRSTWPSWPRYVSNRSKRRTAEDGFLGAETPASPPVSVGWAGTEEDECGRSA